eukprot:TRINITY_DN11500_c0_g3_i4.p1 TRINITY_DN11500_c0_g3~~TRINITY_DN11500_c0_g3_i4.p1  ORF type:complete len:444 (+),score=107.99 TRINITY_DN11500_c0_g3_i4:194-1333(+)
MPVEHVVEPNINNEEQSDRFHSGILEAITAGTTFLESAWQAGVQHLQETEVTTETLDSLTEMATSTLGALEQVGTSAIAIFTQEVGSDDLSQSNNIMDSDEERTTLYFKKTLSVCNVFESAEGKTSKETLEHLSIECMMETQKIYRQLALEQREQLDDLTTHVNDIFEEEKPEDDSIPEIEIEELGLKMKSLIKAFQDAKDSGPQFSEAFGKKLEEAKAKNLSMTDLSALCTAEFSQLEDTYITVLGGLVAKCVQQVLLASQIFLKDKTAIYPEDIQILRSKYIVAISHFFHQEITGLSNSFACTLSLGSNSVTDILKLGECEKDVADSFRSEVTKIENRMLMNVGQALAIAQEAKKLALPVCKLLVSFSCQSSSSQLI